MRASRVVLHVGTPKTGTTYLQSVLWHNRALLGSRGVLVPGTGPESMFLAALDVMAMDWGGEPHPRAAGRWDTLVHEVSAWTGTVIVSQELLAGASVEKARAVVAAFEPARIEVVVTARDLLRQVPAEWQEHVKHGRVKSFAEFWAHLEEQPPQHELAEAFRRVQFLPDVVGRWAAAAPEHEVRLVTVPPADSSSRTLWERFVAACEIDAEGCDLNVAVGNRSLDAVTTSLLRRVNWALLARPLRVDQRDTMLKGVFVNRVLSPLTTPDAAIPVPSDIAASIRTTAQGWRDTLSALDSPVFGDLDDLVPPPCTDRGADPPPDPDRVPQLDELRAASRALAGLLHQLGLVADELTASRARTVAAEQERDALRAQLDEHRGLAPGVRIRRAVIEVGDQVRLVGGALAAYRRVREVWRRVWGLGRPAPVPRAAAPGSGTDPVP